MTDDRTFLWLAQVFFAASCVLTVRRMRAGGEASSLHRLNYIAMIAGFVFHTVFLMMRGRTVQSCPLTNLFEVNAFIAWAAVLFFLLIGPSYRVSFLGAFTSPVALVVCLAGLLLTADVPRVEPVTRSAWVEFHAAIAILACGAFALAFVTGAMYLLQERQLKARRLSPSFLFLPSIEQLDVINYRLLVLGFGMLTIGMVGGMISYRIVGHWTTPKIVWAFAAWLIYAGLIVARQVWTLRGRRVAASAMVSFAFVLITYWGANLLGENTVNLVVIGLNHRSAPVEVRERMAFPRTKLGEATCQLIGASGLREAAIVSTCNRVEIYGLADAAPESTHRIRDFLHEHHRLTENVDAHLYEHCDRECIRHLLEVTCGLDSMVIGETEILGQVKDAYELAFQAGATGIALNRLFQKAFAAAKQIRSTTAIGRGSTSVGSVAVDLAEKIFRDLATCTVMILGTGEMSEATARALRNRGAGTLVVCSRTHERAEALAGQLGGRAISYDEWPVTFPTVDIVISATAAPHPIITREKLIPLMKERRHRPLFLIDIAVPRDVERICSDLADVYLYDIDDLQQIAQENLANREREIATCRGLLTGHTERLLDWFDKNRVRLQQKYVAQDGHAVRPAHVT